MENTEQTLSSASQLGVWELISQAGPTVQFILLLLVAGSVLCWAIIFSKAKLFKATLGENSRFLELFWKSKSLEDIYSKADDFSASTVASVFRSGYKELQKVSASAKGKDSQNSVENIQRALSRASQSNVAGLEKNLTWLATTASAAPFIGLFGTVWGIMNSFRNIGATGAASLAVVAPGISEALIATAIGLAAAIPAVVAYNYFVNQIRKQAVEMDCFSQDFLNIVQRGLSGSGMGGKK